MLLLAGGANNFAGRFWQNIAPLVRKARNFLYRGKCPAKKTTTIGSGPGNDSGRYLNGVTRSGDTNRRFP